MNVQRRLIVLLALGAVAAGGFLFARRYSVDLVAYVVEQTLLQKAPPGADKVELARRFERALSSTPGRAERLQRLMELASRLEKVQRLDSADISLLLEGDPR